MRHIPNLLTLTNLLFGAFSIVLTLKGDQVTGAWFIIFALVFDFLDGLAARALDAMSEIGNLLDSLADMISFGLAPAVAVFVLAEQSADPGPWHVGQFHLLPFFSFIYTAAAAFRLARFSASGSEGTNFRGLPAPAAALFLASLPLIKNRFTGLDILQSILDSQWFLLGISAVLAFLMISRLPMLSLKFSNLKWNENQSRYFLILLSVILIILIQCAAFPIIIFSYILLSLFDLKFEGSR
jgi:CDP-diacylglycerol--serine O-phosphatidyltransferase